MRLLTPPPTLQKINFPQIMVLNTKEPVPIEGIPYVRAASPNKKSDDFLIYTLLVPYLKKNFSYINWDQTFLNLFGQRYKRIPLYKPSYDKENYNGEYYEPDEQEETTLEYLAQDTMSYVDINVLMDLKFIPTFCVDIAKAIKANITNQFIWEDGFNKKVGLCCGGIVPQQKEKTLMILDVSYSIPEGVSFAMMTLLHTLADITNADLILTGGSSHFFTNKEARHLDIERWRKEIPRRNESPMFRKIIEEVGSNYKTVIAFGDSDNPGEIDVKHSVKTLYSFFIGECDRYGNSYKYGAGYARWCMSPSTKVIHNTDWCKFVEQSI